MSIFFIGVGRLKSDVSTDGECTGYGVGLIIVVEFVASPYACVGVVAWVLGDDEQVGGIDIDAGVAQERLHGRECVAQAHVFDPDVAGVVDVAVAALA